MRKLLVGGITALALIGQSLNAKEKPEKNLAWQFSERPSVAVANKLFQSASLHQQDQSMVIDEKPGKHSPVKAVVFSVVLPGAGQAYNKSWIKAVAFLAIEVGGWIGNRHYESEGDRLTDVFETFADAHWSEDNYWASLVADAQSHGISIDINDRQGLQDYERANFSHFLPTTKNQTYYENVGKYDQFNGGWDDGSGKTHQRDSANREAYDFMRADANDQYSAATLLASAILLNHVVSAIDAAWTTNRYNKKIVQSSFGFIRSDNQRLTPALTLKVEW